jgi:hypothetical protein
MKKTTLFLSTISPVSGMNATKVQRRAVFPGIGESVNNIFNTDVKAASEWFTTAYLPLNTHTVPYFPYIYGADECRTYNWLLYNVSPFKPHCLCQNLIC